MKVYQPDGYSYVNITEIPKSEISKIDLCLCNQPSETLENFYKRQSVKPDVLVNCGFFSMADGGTVFGYVDEKTVVSSAAEYKMGIGIIGDNTLVYDNYYNRNDWRDFVSAYPPLVVNGVKEKITFASEINYKARRTACGYNDTTVYIITVDSPGVKFDELQDICIKAGCKYAVNFDGGGSTRELVNGKNITAQGYSRPVDNVMAVYLQQKKTIYRVQVGAFSAKTNADKLMLEIRGLPDKIGAGYANAYVRLIGKYYKVQVGAFSKKEGAQSVVNDLLKLGYNAFISTE